MATPEFDGGFNAASANATAWDPTALVEALLGVTPVYEEQYDLLKLTDDDRLQVRVEANVAPPFMVNRMAHQLGHTKLPPILVTLDDKLGDGNTRRLANGKRENRFYPAWIIPLSYDESTKDIQDRLVFIGRLLNNSNGQPLGRVEQGMMARSAIDMGMNNAQIVGTVGISPTVVRAVRRELRGERALQRVGLEPNTLRGAPLAAVGDFETVHDEPLKSFVELTKDANLAVAEIKSLGADVAKAGSDDAAVRMVEQARDANAQRIADIASGKVGKPPAAKQLRQRLGFITSRLAETMVETTDADMRAHLEAVEQSLGILKEVAALQAAKIEDAGV